MQVSASLIITVACQPTVERFAVDWFLYHLILTTTTKPPPTIHYHRASTIFFSLSLPFIPVCLGRSLFICMLNLASPTWSNIIFSSLSFFSRFFCVCVWKVDKNVESVPTWLLKAGSSSSNALYYLMQSAPKSTFLSRAIHSLSC